MHNWLALRQGLVIIDIVSRLWARQVGLAQAELTVVMLLDLRARSGAELARFSGRSRQNVQRVLNELERRGVITPKTLTARSRVKSWTLTPLGQALADRLRKRMALWEELVSSSVNLSTLTESLRRMVEALVNRPHAGWHRGLQIPREMRIDPEWDLALDALAEHGDEPTPSPEPTEDPLAARRRAREEADAQADELAWQGAREAWRALWA